MAGSGVHRLFAHQNQIGLLSLYDHLEDTSDVPRIKRCVTLDQYRPIGALRGTLGAGFRLMDRDLEHVARDVAYAVPPLGVAVRDMVISGVSDGWGTEYNIGVYVGGKKELGPPAARGSISLTNVSVSATAQPGREVALQSALMRSTRASPASMSTPASA